MDSRIHQLEEIIKKNDVLYWDLGKPQIQDSEYDSYVEELRKLDPQNPLVSEIKYPSFINSDKKIKHDVPMLSLDKVYDLQKLKQWVEKKSRSKDQVFLIQPKYDGISGKIQNYNAQLPLNFDNSILSTRGDGYIGQNISDKLPIIHFNSHKIRANVMFGEIIITNDDFKNIFSKIISPSTKKPYKNPRNATAGIMGTDDISFFKNQGAKLTFIDYDLYSYQVKASEFSEKWDQICQKIQSMPYPMDGIVIKIKDEQYGNSLGVTAHHPKNAIAFKFSNPQKQTKLIDVEWSQGKNCLTPVAIFQPIELDGITINRASLANYQNLRKLDLYIGDYVVVERAGRVIPHIISVKHNENAEQRINPFISACPFCHSQLIVKLPQLICTNDKCVAKQIKQFLYSLRVIGIQNIGIPTIEKIISHKNINNLIDFLKLNINDFIECGLGDKTSQNLYNQFLKHKTIYDYQFLSALNIQGIGEQVSKLILNTISLEELIKLNSIESLLNIKGIGNILSDKIINYLKNNNEYINNMMKCFVIVKSEQSDPNTKTVCFTGAMQQPRKYYQNIAKNKGIKPVSTVTSNLSYLVVADKNSTSSKMQKAQKYNIQILTVEQFMNL